MNMFTALMQALEARIVVNKEVKAVEEKFGKHQAAIVSVLIQQRVAMKARQGDDSLGRLFESTKEALLMGLQPAVIAEINEHVDRIFSLAFDKVEKGLKEQCDCPACTMERLLDPQ